MSSTIIPISLYQQAMENMGETYSHIAVEDVHLLEICRVLAEDATGIKLELAEQILKYYKISKLGKESGVCI